MSSGASRRVGAAILAFDTATSTGTVGLRSRGKLVTASLGEPRAFGADLMPAIVALLGRAGVGFSELDAVLVGAGPGSFTGVRIGAATAKGLVHALGVPLFAYPSLLAAARGPAWSPSGHRGVLFDARGERIYWCVASAEPEAPCLVPPSAGEIEDVVSWAAQEGVWPDLGGSGALRHRAWLEEAGFRVIEGSGVPAASGLIELLDADPRPTPVPDPRKWEPLYLRAWSGSGGRTA